MDRFQFVSKEAEEDRQKGFVPGNTQQSMQWAMKVSTDWKKAREFALEEAFLEGLLKRVNPEDLVMWLCLWQDCKTVKGPLCVNMSECTVNITFKLMKLHHHLHHFQPLCQKSWIKFWKASQDLTV